MKSYLSLLTILAVMVVGWLPLCPASAQSVAGTTIITHGFGSDTTGWAYSLALAIQAKSGGKIHATKITASSPLRVEFDAPLYDASRSDALGPNGSGGLILLVDWSDIDTFWDNSALGFSTTDVATALDAKIMATHPQVYRGPIHLIGHSRGGSLIMALAKLLGTRGIWVDHQTTLDRHPTVMGTLTWDFAGSVVGSNVVFADDYFSDGIDRAPQGYPTEGAAKFDLSAFVDGTVSGGSSCSPLFGSVFVRAHTQVHAYYHGTVDAWATCDGDGTPIEPSWYAGLNQPSKAHTGFAYARKMGGTDLSSVPWPGTGTNAAFGSGLLAGSAARDPVALDPNSSPWPNVMAVPQASYSFVAGQAVPIPYIYQRQGTLGMDVVIDLDDDTNPYNAVPQTSPCNRRLATIALSPSSTPQKGTFTWQTNSLDRVPGCYVVLRARTYTSSSPPLIDQERFDYLPSQLTVSASLPTSSITSFTVPPNYPPNQDVSQTLSVPGAQNLAVTINGSLVQGDFLIITDQSGNVIRQLTGSLTQSFNVVGSQIKVQFHGTSFYGGGSTNGVTLSVSATTSPASTFAIGANYGWLSSIGDYSQTLSVPGAQNLAVTINGSLVQGDFLIITDQSGNVIRQLTGSLTQSFNVVGSQIKVQFHGTSFYGGGSTNGVTLSVSATTSPASTFAIGANYGWLSSIGDYSQTLSVPGAQNLAVTINGSLVQGDFLIITDQSGNVIRQLTGSLTQSFNVVGSQIKVQFHGTSFYGGGSTNGVTLSVSATTSPASTFAIGANYGWLSSIGDYSQTLSVPGAQNLAVTINGSLVQGDFLIITDQSGNVIRQLTGSLTQSFNVVGSQIKVQFHGTSFYGGGSTNGVTLSVSATTSPASTFAIGANYGWLSSIGDYSQTLSVPGAQNLAVTINGSLVQGDFLIITDQSGNVIRQLTGSLTQSFNVVGSQIKVQFHGTSFYGGGSTNGVTLSVGAASALAPDTTPDQLSFVSVSSAIPGYSTVSNAVFISGINTPVQATVTAGLMRVNGGPWRNYAYVTLGDRVELLVRNSQLSATTVTAVLQVGGITAPFSVTTLDIEPDAFRFTPQHYVAVNSVRSSDCVTVTGLGSEGATSYVVNGEYQIGCSGSFSASAALLRNGDTVRVRHISSISAGSVVATKFCVGTYCTSFQSTTAGGTFACNLDISGDGLTNGDDAILLLRYLAGFRGDALVAGIRLGSLRPTVVDVTLALSDTTQFDVFGRSPITSASLLLDGLVLSRLLLGFPESTVLAGIAIPQDAANQSTASLRTYINRRCNTAF